VTYPVSELAQLYKARWQIETNLRHLKQTMKMDVLHCETVEGVLKELTVFALVYNMVRAVMCAAADRQGVAVERISFADALG
jgi:IS4 transposase